MLHKCSSCCYMSENIGNVKRHMERKHNIKIKENNNLSNNTIDLSNNTSNLSNNTQNLPNNTQNLSDNTIDKTKDHNSNKCKDCDKIFSTKYVLAKHINQNKCKKVKNKLECNICHKIFNFQSGLSRHRKSCRTKQLMVINNTTNNNTNITNNITNNNITNNNNITYNVIVYNTENIEFNDQHITKRDLRKIFNGANKQAIESILQYGYKLLENIENRCVEKKHITNSYCKVHIGDNKWEQRPDTNVIDRFSQDVAISANDKLYDHPTIGETELRDEIAHLASHPENVHANAISLRREMRTLLLNRSNDVNNKNNS